MLPPLCNLALSPRDTRSAAVEALAADFLQLLRSHADVDVNGSSLFREAFSSVLAVQSHCPVRHSN